MVTAQEHEVSGTERTVAALAERRSRPGGLSLSATKPDRLKSAKSLVEKAVKLRKVFSVQGPYPVIRAALWSRGWVERRLPHPVHRATEQVVELEKQENPDDMYDLMSRLVRNETTYFYWTTRHDDVDHRSLRSDQMTNHFDHAGTFTTKVGLCLNLRNLQWFDTADPDTFFPRCYRLGAEDETLAFIDDFRRTACTSLLQLVVETSGRWGDGEEVEDRKAKNRVRELDTGKHRSVSSDMIATALHVCEEFLSVLDHGDIDVTVETQPSVTERQWAEFLQHYYMVVHEGAVIRGGSVFAERCQAMLKRMREVCPQLDTDGLKNIWIIKPGAKSRGRGILCLNRLDEILALADADRALNYKSKWVVQKYLERPLLAYDTKFDLRQWFLVTDWNPLTVWFYRECYLRFSTQPYSTKTLDSAVHLCNNSIQKHFQPSRKRHPGVPEDNMWSCSQFRAFLRLQGCEAKWESVVVPGMQQAVVCALQTAQDLVEHRKASFELYGADFMLGTDLRPWLLEINASPTMACSTSVTARLCPAVQLDALRVVLDRRADPSAYTGGFHLIYKQAAVEVPQYIGVNLLVEGVPIRRKRLHKESGISKALFTFPSEQAVAVLQNSGKENRATGEKKRQITSISPQRQGEGRTQVQSTPSVRRNHEPQRKARCLALGLSSNGVTLVPRSFSFSLNPPKNTPDTGKTQSNPGRASRVSRSFLPQTALEPQIKTSTCDFPPLAGRGPRGPLPALKDFSLRPNLMAVACRNTTLHPQFSLHRHQVLLGSDRHSMAKSDEDCTGEPEPQRNEFGQSGPRRMSSRRAALQISHYISVGSVMDVVES